MLLSLKTDDLTRNCVVRNFVVLVSAGSFNPPTHMHLRLFGMLFSVDFHFIASEL